MAIYAVGDIQGCYDPLARLLEKVNFDQSKDTLLCVGDLVNRGPNSLGVLNLLKSLENQCVTVLGNHDIHLLAMAYGIRQPKPTDTLQQVLQAPNLPEITHWLRHQPLLVMNKKSRYALCHAGIYPWWSRDLAKANAKEVEKIFRNEEKCIKLLKKIYSNSPYKWKPDLRKVQRRRFTINAFTRMRFCGKNGRLNFAESGYTGKIRKNRIPWFQLSNSDFNNFRIIFGHWSAAGFINKSNFLGLDTGCVWGRHLTLVKIPKQSNKLKPIKQSNIYISPNF